jgi:hypothetical protein
VTPIAEQRARTLIAEGRHLCKYDLAAAVPCTQENARRVLLKLHRIGEVSIVAWIHFYQMPIPVFGPKAGKDKPRPRALTQAQKAKRWRRNNPEAVIAEVMEKRRKYRLTKKGTACAST